MDDKKNLVKDIANFSIDEHIEIFKIIKNNTDKYTINDNGVFINLSTMDNSLFEKIKKFADYCIDIKKNDEKIQTEKKNLLDSIVDKNSNKNLVINDGKNIDENGNNIPVENETTDNIVSLKRSKQKYGGNKARIIKSIKT